MKKTVRMLLLPGLFFCICEHGAGQVVAKASSPPQSPGLQLQDNSQRARSLKEVLQEFKDHYKVDILYFNSMVDGYAVPSKEVILGDNFEISLGNVLKPLGLGYRKGKKGGYVIVEKKIPAGKGGKSIILPEKRTGSRENQGQNDGTNEVSSPLEDVLAKRNIDNLIKGKIKDEKGEGLPGVNIVQKGTQRGTSSDANGSFEIEVSDPAAVLVFSSVGYLSQEITVGSKTFIDLVIKVDTKTLEEIVVVGYGTQKKANLTGAVSNVGADVIENRPVTNLGQALQGTISNLNISQSDGSLGKGATFNIRGNTSINGGGPLILVNNIPMDVNLINPADIESVTVLKDAASAAIYGARAAYGVILITTKSGKGTSKPMVSLSMNYSVNKPSVRIETMDAMERMLFMNEGNLRASGQVWSEFDKYGFEAISAHYYDPTQPEVFTHPNSPSVWMPSANTDWARELMRDSYPMQQYTASISGVADKFNYYSSFSYFNQKGITRHFDEKYNRYNIMTNLSYDITKWFTLGTKISINNSKKVYPPNDASNSWDESATAFHGYAIPSVPIYLPDGNYFQYGAIPNFVQMQKEGGYRTRGINDSWLTGTVKLTPVKNMTFNVDYSFNVNDTKELDYRRQMPKYDKAGLVGYYGGTNPSSVARSNYNNKYYVFNAYADYANTFKEKHYLKMIVGMNQENASNSFFQAKREKLIVGEMPYIDLASGDRYAFDSESEYAIRGVFSRINYIYDDRYLVEFNGRYDGSSKFSKSDRFAFFPSISAGWRVDNEKFFSGLKGTINMLKIRGSYGNLGNQNVTGNYPYIATFTSGEVNYLINGERPMTVYAPGLVSPSLTWETVTQRNFGIDFAVLGNKLTGSFDLYRRDTKNMLTKSQTLPAVLAENEPKSNAGDMKTTGFDLNIEWKHNIRKVKYNITFLLADYKAEITRYSNPNGIISDFYVGHRLGEIWGLETGGLFQTDDEAKALDQSQIDGRRRDAGDLWFVDQDGDGKITMGKQTLTDHGDMKIIGNNTPRFSYGFKSQVSWKGFDLDLFLQGVAKRDVILDNKFYLNQYYDAHWSPLFKLGLDYWTPDNRDALYPRPWVGRAKDVVTPQTRYMQNASYIRLKQLTLGYNIPATFIKKLGIDRMKVYFSGNNLWEATKMIKISDPEQAGSRFYPLPRAISVGANINF